MEGDMIDEAVKERALQKRGELTSGKVITILLIEDDTRIRELFKRMLEMEGYYVIEAVDGEEGIQKFLQDKERINLVLSDVSMPGKNGNEVCELILELVPNMKIVLMTAYDENSLRTKKMFMDGVVLLRKPMLGKFFLAEIKKALESNSHQAA